MKSTDKMTPIGVNFRVNGCQVVDKKMYKIVYWISRILASTHPPQQYIYIYIYIISTV